MSCQSNYTLTHYAEHVEGRSHDAINRYMAKAQLRPGTLWRLVKEHIVPSDDGFVVFDDTLLDKRYARPYCAVGDLLWSKREEKEGKTVKIKDCPKDHKVRLFRVLAFPGRTDFIATNDKTCQSSDAVRQTCAVRWKIEQLHRVFKQTCGIERCQCRLNRIQRNHIACAFLVWNRLKTLANETSNTVYQIKQDLLKSYLVNELKSPSISFVAA